MTPTQVKLLQTYKKILLALDFSGLTFIFVFVFTLRMNLSYSEAIKHPLFFWIEIVTIASLYVFGAYDLNAKLSHQQRFFRVLAATGSGFGLFIGLIYLTRTQVSGLLGRGVLIPSFLAFLTFAFIIRYLLELRLNFLRTSRWNWLAFGSSIVLEKLAVESEKNPILGQLETIPISTNVDYELVLNRLQQPWEGLIIVSHSDIPREISNILLDKRLSGLQIVNLPQIYENFWKKLPVFHLDNHWFLTSAGFSIAHNLIGLRIKRLMDLSLSLILLMVTWPILLLTSLALIIEGKGPIFFSQIRTGKDGKDFSILKFRSMTVDAESNGAQWAKKNDVRVTTVGKWIRATRIDELPQIFNVLKGDMSFIGPRPERPEFNEQLEQQIPFYQLRHLLRPGITGWAQVMYPYGASIEDSMEKLQFDLYYIKNHSLTLDLMIILRTVRIVLFGKGR